MSEETKTYTQILDDMMRSFKYDYDNRLHIAADLVTNEQGEHEVVVRNLEFTLINLDTGMRFYVCQTYGCHLKSFVVPETVDEAIVELSAIIAAGAIDPVSQIARRFYEMVLYEAYKTGLIQPAGDVEEGEEEETE